MGKHHTRSRSRDSHRNCKNHNECQENEHKNKCHDHKGRRGCRGPTGATGATGPTGATGATGTFDTNTCVEKLNVGNIQGCSECFEISSDYVSTKKVIFDSQGSTGCDPTVAGTKFYWDPTKGSIIQGKQSEANLFSTGANTFGSEAKGEAKTGGKISTGEGSGGSEAKGGVSEEGNISTGEAAEGSEAKGKADGGTISTGKLATGSEAKGGASEGGKITSGEAAVGSEAKGLVSDENSEISTKKGSVGSESKGVASEGGKITSGEAAFGSEAKGKAENSEISTGKAAVGSEAKGQASEGTISTGEIAVGSEAKGLVSDENSEISTKKGAVGSEAKGAATTGGKITSGEAAFGSEAKGGAGENSEISTGKAAVGSEAKGATIGENSKILTLENAVGSEAKGFAKDGRTIISGGFGSRACGITLPQAGNVAGDLKAEGVASYSEGAANTADSNYSHAYGSNVHTNGIEGVLIQGKNGWAKNITEDDNQTSYSIQLAFGDNTTGSGGPNGIGMILSCDTPAPAPNGYGSASSWTTSGADYAEYFEWEDSNVKNEDRIGYFVALGTDKIKLASKSEDVVGIITGTAGVLGDAGELAWEGTNNKDVYGRDIKVDSYLYTIDSLLSGDSLYSTELANLIRKSPDNKNLKVVMNKYLDQKLTKLSKEDKNVKKINDLKSVVLSLQPTKVVKASSKFNPTNKYVSRSSRKEWSPVGMMGKIYVRDNGLCKPGQKCSCANGIAIPGSDWKVLSRVDSKTIRILYFMK